VILTVHAEYARPCLFSFQHPPLLISHRPDPEAKITRTSVKIQKALETNVDPMLYTIATNIKEKVKAKTITY
jgi:hypothetical protein